MLCRMFCLSLVLVGCGANYPNREQTYQVAPSFSASHQALVSQGVHEWETALNGYLVFRENYHEPIMRFTPTDLITLNPNHAEISEQGGKRVVGWCTRVGYKSHIEIAEDLKDDLFSWVVLHEVGHALGLKHSETGTVMCDMDHCASPQITEQDLDQFRRVWGLPSKEER